MNFTLLNITADYQKKYSVGPILYHSVKSSVLRLFSKAPAAFEADNTCTHWLFYE